MTVIDHFNLNKAGDDRRLLVQFMVISHFDYCSALLTGLPACAVKPADGPKHLGTSGLQSELKEHTPPLSRLHQIL